MEWMAPEDWFAPTVQKSINVEALVPLPSAFCLRIQFCDDGTHWTTREVD
jgi:hypothetical protein